MQFDLMPWNLKAHHVNTKFAKEEMWADVWLSRIYVTISKSYLSLNALVCFLADKTGISYKMLNTRKGPAVWVKI